MTTWERENKRKKQPQIPRLGSLKFCMLLNFGRNIVNKFHAIITHIYDNPIKFEVSLDFWRIWPTVWHPYFRTNQEISGNLSKCFVCIGSIFQIGYTLLQRTKARVTMVIHYLCNKAWSDFSTMAKLEMEITLKSRVL